MSVSKKKKSSSSAEKTNQIELISFRVFFHRCLAKGMVRSWQEREIHAFFRGLGLTDKEPTDSYKIALEKY